MSKFWRWKICFEKATVWIQLWKRYKIELLTVSHVDLALEQMSQFPIGYDDALILASTRMAKGNQVLSEDL